MKLDEKSKIVPLFRSLSFRSVPFTCVLYHDLDSKTLISGISFNRELEFEGKRTLVLPVSEYIKIGKNTLSVSEKEINNIAAWLHEYFPSEALRIW